MRVERTVAEAPSWGSQLEAQKRMRQQRLSASMELRTMTYRSDHPAGGRREDCRPGRRSGEG